MVTGEWEGDVFVATRMKKAATRKRGNTSQSRQTVQRRWIDPETGHLVVEQDWGGSESFVARYEKQPSR